MPLPTTSTSSKIPAGSCNHTKSIAPVNNRREHERSASGTPPAAASPEPRGDTRTQPLTRRDARSMSTRLFAGESFAIFADCSRFFRALQTPLIIAVLAPRVRSGLQPRSIVRDDDEDDGGDDEAQRSLGQCMAEEWRDSRVERQPRGGTREDHKA